MRPSEALLLGAALALLLQACTPSCDQACRKVVSCDVSPRLSLDECTNSCQRQRDLIDLEDDDELNDAFSDHRSCIVQSSCEELRDGVCFDDALFAF